jgi:drug/metabolite transporter (DMT)-like permease
MTKTPESHSLTGILTIMAAVAMFSVMDAVAKQLTQSHTVLTVLWARYAFHTLLLIVVLGPRLGFGLVRTKRPAVQAVRGTLLAGASVCFVGAIKYMPLAESLAIFFIAPVLVTLLAVLTLKEKVSAAGWLAVAGGFAGVLIIIRPGSAVFSWPALLPIGTAIFFASYQVLTRRVAGLESPYVSNFYSGIVGLIIFSIALPGAWVPPASGFDAALFVLVGMISGLSHLTLIKAYDFAPASRLAPFSYTQLVWATLIGYFVFGDFPDRWSLIGIAVVITSGIYIATHQHLSSRTARRQCGSRDGR